MKYIHIIFLSIALLPSSLSAMEITELMYDLPGTDSNREWVEIRNQTSEDIDLTNWKLFEADVDHKIESYEGYEGLVSQGEYVIIADSPKDFLLDNPSYQGLLYKSVFSLSNTGELLGIVNSSGEIISTVEYSKSLGAKGNGNSLQLFEDVLIEGVPTPGAENVKIIHQESDADLDAGEKDVLFDNHSSHQDQIELSTAQLSRTIYIDIGRDRQASVHSTLHFEAAAAGQQGSRKVKFLWNFGDGTTKTGRRVHHEYRHEGIYNVVVNAITGTNRAVARVKVHIFKSDLELKKVEEGILVQNRLNNEINIGEFYLKQGKRKYTFPKDTIIDAQTSILFDWSKLRFNPVSVSEESILLFHQNGKLIEI